MYVHRNNLIFRFPWVYFLFNIVKPVPKSLDLRIHPFKFIKSAIKYITMTTDLREDEHDVCIKYF